jgi:hypothetical protein
VLLTVAALSAALGIIWLVVAPGEPSQETQQGTQQTFGCISWNTADSQEVCDKSAADQAKRQPATDAQRAEAQSVMNDIDRVVRRVGRCLTSDGNPCAGGAATRPATDADAEAAGQALSNAGLRSTVRVARPDDPAPAGSLFYAIELPSGACVVGHVSELPGGAGGTVVTGTLPDGRCIQE